MRLIAAAAALALGMPAAAPAADPPAARPDQNLTLRAWLGGTEPGTSKNAFEGQAAWRKGDLLEIAGGASWTDNIFYTASKGFAEGSWFYREFSYLRAAFTYRSYDYTGANRPTPDSNAYQNVPRPELEISHLFAERVRVGANYQLFLPNFQFDTGKRIANHKFSGSVEAKIAGGLSASVMAAVLLDPSPGRTRIVNRHLPSGMAPDLLSASPDYVCGTDPATNTNIYCAGRTAVVQRTELLVGGGLAWEDKAWGASVRYIPNRDLDSGFAWSVISGLDLRPVDRLSFQLAWIHDRYSDTSGPTFAGKDGEIFWGSARYQFLPELALGGGLKWVTNPGQASTTGTATRNDATLLLQAEYRIGPF